MSLQSPRSQLSPPRLRVVRFRFMPPMSPRPGGKTPPLPSVYNVRPRVAAVSGNHPQVPGAAAWWLRFFPRDGFELTVTTAPSRTKTSDVLISLRTTHTTPRSRPSSLGQRYSSQSTFQRGGDAAGYRAGRAYCPPDQSSTGANGMEDPASYLTEPPPPSSSIDPISLSQKKKKPPPISKTIIIVLVGVARKATQRPPA